MIVNLDGLALTLVFLRPLLRFFVAAAADLVRLLGCVRWYSATWASQCGGFSFTSFALVIRTAFTWDDSFTRYLPSLKSSTLNTFSSSRSALPVINFGVLSHITQCVILSVYTKLSPLRYIGGEDGQCTRPALPYDLVPATWCCSVVCSELPFVLIRRL